MDENCLERSRSTAPLDIPIQSIERTRTRELRNCYRSIWISDLHLGTRRCRAGALVDFLRNHQAEKLYLVGDIVDGWNCGPSWYWDAAQRGVAEEIRGWQRRGTQLIFLPGNHDEFSGALLDSLFSPDSIQSELIHTTAEGRRMLTLHGHQFHRKFNPTRWLSMMGTQGCAAASRITDWFDERSQRGHRNRRLNGYLKQRVKRAADYLSDIDDRAVLEAGLRHRVDGVICGHIHRAEQRMIGSIWYINDGDWVENCSALAEHRDGTLQLIRWGSEPNESNESRWPESIS